MSLASQVQTEKASGGFNITTANAVPDLNHLLIAKMLAEIKPTDNAFGRLAWEETKYLRESRKLLKTDAMLHMKFGGSGLDACMKLSNVLKQRAEARYMESLLDKSAGFLVNESIFEKSSYSFCSIFFNFCFCTKRKP